MNVLIGIGLGLFICAYGWLGYRFGYEQGNWEGKVAMMRAMKKDDEFLT